MGIDDGSVFVSDWLGVDVSHALSPNVCHLKRKHFLDAISHPQKQSVPVALQEFKSLGEGPQRDVGVGGEFVVQRHAHVRRRALAHSLSSELSW